MRERRGPGDRCVSARYLHCGARLAPFQRGASAGRGHAMRRAAQTRSPRQQDTGEARSFTVASVAGMWRSPPERRLLALRYPHVALLLEELPRSIGGAAVKELRPARRRVRRRSVSTTRGNRGTPKRWVAACLGVPVFW